MRVHRAKMCRISMMVFALFLLGMPFVDAQGWGAPHVIITRTACDALPQRHKELWGKELAALGSSYCLLPDQVYSDKEKAKFAQLESQPKVVYQVGLHLPPAHAEAYELLRYFFGKSVAEFQAGRKYEAACYAGTVSHMLEDWSCPAHAVPGDNMFTLFKQFLPPPEEHQDTLLHSPLENGKFTLDLKDYKPHLYGTTVEDAAFNLLNKSHATTVFARGQVIPIINGLYEKNDDVVNSAQQNAAIVGAEIVADALYTLICIAEQKFEPQAEAALQSVDISGNYPLEAPKLYMPQSSFFSKPYWGYAKVGKILKDGKDAVPLKLRIKKGQGVEIQQLASGIGTGTHSVLTYFIPADVYKSFTVTVGVHPELGAEGRVNFQIKSNGVILGKAGPLSGADTAQTLDINLKGVTNLQLIASSAGGDGKGNYAIWGSPKLVK
jgi:hypothetical protein